MTDEFIPPQKPSVAQITDELIEALKNGRVTKILANKCAAWGVDAARAAEALANAHPSALTDEEVCYFLEMAGIDLRSQSAAQELSNKMKAELNRLDKRENKKSWPGPWQSKQPSAYLKYDRAATLERLNSNSRAEGFSNRLSTLCSELKLSFPEQSPINNLFTLGAIELSTEELFSLQRRCVALNFFPFRSSENAKNLLLSPSADPLDAIVAIDTAGTNVGVQNDDIVAWMAEIGLPRLSGLEVVSSDRLVGNLLPEKPVSKEFTEEVFKLCPDVVWQGANTLNKLKKTMEKTKQLYLWWD